MAIADLKTLQRLQNLEHSKIVIQSPKVSQELSSHFIFFTQNRILFRLFLKKNIFWDFLFIYVFP